MTKQKTYHMAYDMTELLQLIDNKYGNINNFADAAKIDVVKFLEEIAESDLSVDHIKLCVDLLSIPHEEIGFYFFRPVDVRTGKLLGDNQNG